MAVKYEPDSRLPNNMKVALNTFNEYVVVEPSNSAYLPNRLVVASVGTRRANVKAGDNHDEAVLNYLNEKTAW